MVDELRGLLALRLAHRLEDAGLGDAAEIVVDRRPPAGLDHVEPDRAREAIGLDETALHAVNRDARAAIAVALLVERIDPEGDAMRQQRGAAGVVEGGEPVPESGLVLRQVGLPGLVPFRDRLRGRAVLQVRRLDREETRAALMLRDKLPAAACWKVSRQSLCSNAVIATWGLFATASRSASVR